MTEETVCGACYANEEGDGGEDVALADFFEHDLEKMAIYLYAEYKFDVPWPCIRRHFAPDIEWIFGSLYPPSLNYYYPNILTGGPNPNDALPLCGRYVGHDAMASWLERVRAPSKQFESDLTLLKMNKELTVKRWRPKSFITDKDKHKIVVVMDCAYIVNKTGKSYEGTYSYKRIDSQSLTPLFFS